MEVDSNRERGGAVTGWSHQPTMVELHSSGVLKDIDRFGGERGNVLGDPLTGHFRKRVVHQASIKTRNKGTWGTWGE